MTAVLEVARTRSPKAECSGCHDEFFTWGEAESHSCANDDYIRRRRRPVSSRSRSKTAAKVPAGTSGSGREGGDRPEPPSATVPAEPSRHALLLVDRLLAYDWPPPRPDLDGRHELARVLDQVEPLLGAQVISRAATTLESLPSPAQLNAVVEEVLGDHVAAAEDVAQKAIDRARTSLA